MIIIGEKINGSIPIVAEAIAKRDSEFIKERAKLQAESGATYIDCCASGSGRSGNIEMDDRLYPGGYRSSDLN